MILGTSQLPRFVPFPLGLTRERARKVPIWIISPPLPHFREWLAPSIRRALAERAE